MKRIPIRDKKKQIVAHAIVDDKNYEFLEKFKWHLSSSSRKTRYALTHPTINGLKSHKKVSMHSLVLKPKNGKQIDHKNGNGLDNRCQNLRQVSLQVNLLNQSLRSTNTSGERGVYFDKESGKWRVYFTKFKERFYGGRFKNKASAIKKARQMKKRLFSKEGPVRA